ncbi:Putative BTB/POZ domain-containing protein [Septoria linicola]|uniref:BTB/POZ domain-containing protein n=1 Tax=Septoria linicola TaxID=215465 RepID=A0A9Q9EJB8_9PEZI|nr:Putative BTB/POZ domain-containing protein [Septoria linicola]
MSVNAGTYTPAAALPATSKLFGDARWSNLEIRCGEKTWKVHRNIVCSQCEFFEKATEGSFRESSNGVVVLEEDDPSAIEVLLRFFYTGTYVVPTDDGEKSWSPLALPVLVHTMADKYGVPRLVDFANTEFTSRAKEMGQSTALIEAIAEIYATFPHLKKEMRDTVVHIVATNYQNFKTGAAFEGCQAVFDAAPFIADVLEWLMEERTLPKGSTKYICPSAICHQDVIMRTLPDSCLLVRGKHCPSCGTKWRNNTANGWMKAP